MQQVADVVEQWERPGIIGRQDRLAVGQRRYVRLFGQGGRAARAYAAPSLARTCSMFQLIPKDGRLGTVHSELRPLQAKPSVPSVAELP